MSEDFGADLIELAVAAFLRAFATEHRSDVVEFYVPRQHLHSVLDVGANYACGRLRP